MTNLHEGFFSKPAMCQQNRMLNSEKYKGELSRKLLNGEKISKDEWVFIDNYMDGYVQCENDLQKMCIDAVTAYGNKVSLNWINTSRIHFMSKLFTASVFKYFNGDVSRWDTSSVIDMEAMFSGCIYFNCDLSGWDVSNVTQFNEMFYGCHWFNQELGRWDVSKATTMELMFADCYKFNGNISGWDVSNVTAMGAMFDECRNFKQDLSNWDVTKYTNGWYHGKKTAILSIFENDYWHISKPRYMPVEYMPKYDEQQ